MSECLLDSSALIELFEGTEEGSAVCDIIEERLAATTLLAIAEISDFYARRQKNPLKQVSFVQQHVRILDLTLSACIAAGALKAAHRKKHASFGLADAIMYAIARENDMMLVSKDTDFSGLEHVQLIS